MIASIFALSLLQGVDAAVWGEVDAIWAPDASGTWRRTDRSGGALLLEGTEESVLEVGQELEEGAQLRTTQARVRIRLRKRGQVVVRPESEVRLEQRGVLQDVGEVFYSVEGTFRVLYRGVEAAVEGTQFSVGPGAGDGTVQVSVGEGRVRVASAGESSLVLGGEGLEVLPSSVPQSAVVLTSAALKELRAVRRELGLPSASVSVLGTGSLSMQGLEFQRGLRVQGRIRLAPGMRLVVESGFSGDASRFHLEESVGVETAVGPLGFGVHGDLEVGESVDCEGEVTPVGVRIGASSTFRYRLSIPHSWGIESQLRLRYDGEISGELGLGVSRGF
ncbi:MAG: hypothetical protein VXW32_16065 [Myxococcota bacterium]|nr:hypothetical protein [Myxococcota bacterium]